jgi:hypothetical protein
MLYVSCEQDERRKVRQRTWLALASGEQQTPQYRSVGYRSRGKFQKIGARFRRHPLVFRRRALLVDPRPYSLQPRLGFLEQLAAAMLVETGEEEAGTGAEVVHRTEERGLLKSLPGTKLQASPLGEQCL